MKKEIKTKYKVDCELIKLCEFDCFSADAAEKLCHKLLQPIHLEDEYFKPYLKYIIYAMKRSCYIVNRECELTNSYIIPEIYTGEEMVDDLYAFIDERKGEEPLRMNVEESLEQARSALSTLLGGAADGDGALFCSSIDQPLAIEMSEEMIEQYRKEAIEGYKREEMDKVIQILIDEGCRILTGGDGSRIVPRKDCIENLNLSISCSSLRGVTKHSLHEIDESFHRTSIGLGVKDTVKALLRSNNARVSQRLERVIIEAPLEGDTLQ